MRKSIRIPLILLIAVVLCGSAYSIGYYYSARQWEGRMAQEPALLDSGLRNTVELRDSDKSAAVAAATCEYVLGEQDGYIIVYYADRETVYSNTDIQVAYLSEELKKEIEEGKPIYSEQELYNFLESHSS